MNVNEGLSPITLSTGQRIGPGEPCFVVAEIGQNHNGDAYTATRLLLAAHEAGVDAVKFCKRDILSDLTAAARAAPYNGPQSFGETYGEHRAALELTAEEYAHLQQRMRYNGWPEVFFATACDQISVEVLEDTVRPPLYKVASRDLDNLPLLRHIARLGKPVILSAGMARDDAEICAALEIVRDGGCPAVLLVCTSEYPTPPLHVGLKRLEDYRFKFNVLVGLSDHTSGIVAAQAAATLGACVIEKHVTLSRAMKGTDHAASLEPDGVKRLVRNIRLVEQMRGFSLSPEDWEPIEATRRKLGRSLVSARFIPAGKVIEWDDLTLKSPGDGIRYADVGRVVGYTATADIPPDTTIIWEHVFDPRYKAPDNLSAEQREQIDEHEEENG